MKSSSRKHVSFVLFLAYLSSVVTPLRYLSAAPAGNNGGWHPPPAIHSSMAVPNTSAPVSTFTPSGKLPEISTDQDLLQSRMIGRQLYRRKGKDAGAGERRALGNALRQFTSNARSPQSQRLSFLTGFLDQHPQSTFAGPLWLHVAEAANLSGNFKLSAYASLAAWLATKDADAGEQQALETAEAALSLVMYVYAHTGQKSQLKLLLDSVAARPPHPVSSAALSNARNLLKWWESDPTANVFCGITAYNEVAQFTKAPLLDKHAITWEPDTILTAEQKVEEAEYIQHGLSAARLVERINNTGASFRVVKRRSGKMIPVPSVVHFLFGDTEGHYSAVLSGDDQGTRVADPHLGFEGVMENAVLNAQASGFFIVPATLELSHEFVDASNEEMLGVYGRITCPISTTDKNCNSPAGDCSKMTVYRIAEFLPGVLLDDQPVPYKPAYGPSINFTLSYRQVSVNGRENITRSSNFGECWSHSLLSYIRSENGSAILTGTAVRWITPNGTYSKYLFDGVQGAWTADYASMPVLNTLPAGGGQPTGYYLTFSDGSVMTFTQPDTAAADRLYLTSIMDPQGRTLSLSYDTSCRLVQITDATQKVTSLQYQGDSTKIQSITDPFGRIATFTYDSTGMLSSITDPIGIKSSFTYDLVYADRVASLTTPYGTTTFQYEGSSSTGYGFGTNWSVTAIDPEGQVEKMQRFYESGHVNSAYEQSVASSLYNELQNHVPPATISVGGTPVSFSAPHTAGQVPTTDDHFHVSFHWTKKYWGEYQKAMQSATAGSVPVDPHTFAHATLWLMDNDASRFTTSVPVASKDPGWAMIWYNYPDQPQPIYAGSDNQPIKSARQIEDKTGALTWVMTQQTYNAVGLPLVSTDELGRRARYTYASNNIDVLTEEVATGSSTWATVRTNTYPSGVANHHLPSTITEISGRVTTFTRNSNDQVTQIQVHNGANTEAVQHTYDPNGMLTTIQRTDPIASANWVTIDTFTYDSCNQVRTHADASNYTLTFDYDKFDDLTIITYPDGTTEQFSYDRKGLDPTTTIGTDVTAKKDRAGRWTRIDYNSSHQPVAEMTPDGKITRYDWCKCGALWKLTDPLGRVTEWQRDILGRPTIKTMPDGTKHSYTYEPRSGRVSTVKRPNDQTAANPTVTYHYNLDGARQREHYSPSSTAAAVLDVTYYYTTTLAGSVQDPLGRPTFVTDGIGTHTFSYYPLTQNMAGAGRLKLVNGALTDDNLAYSYDWQDRLNTRTLQTQANPPATQRTDTRTWDSLGRTHTVVNDLGTFTYNYNTNLDRPDSLNAPNGIVSSYAHFNNSTLGAKAQRLNSITHSNGGTQYSSHAFDYDTAERITSWIKQASALTGTQADSSSSYGYNLSDEVTSYVRTQTAAPNTVLEQQSWQYDADGNWDSSGIKNISTGTTNMATRSYDTGNNTGNSTGNRLTQIGGAGKTVVEGVVNEFSTVQVTSGGNPAQTATLVQDPANNGFRFRAEVPVAQGSNSLQIKATDQGNLVTTKNYTFSIGAVTSTFTYDNNGNLLTDGQRTFTWDAKNRLKSVAVGGHTYKWDYDYRDRRVREYMDTATVPATQFIWDGNQIIQERTGTTMLAGTVRRTHHFGGFADGSTGATKYQTTTDHLGNIREVIAASGTSPAIGSVVTRYDYTPFQGPMTPAKLTGTNVDATFQTIGRYYHHAATGLELALYRAYDPALGRWISEDPIAEGGGLNLYTYVLNRPVTFVDRLGLDVYTINRKLGSNGEESGTARSICNPFTHTFVAVVDKDGVLSTYSWGNAGSTSDWADENRQEDINAANEAINSSKANIVDGSHDYDQNVKDAYDRLKNDPNSHHRNGIFRNNCKSEANKLLREAGL